MMSRAYREGHGRIFGGRTVVNRDDGESDFVVVGRVCGMPLATDSSMPKDSFEIRSKTQIARWDPVNGCVVWESPETP